MSRRSGNLRSKGQNAVSKIRVENDEGWVGLVLLQLEPMFFVSGE